MLRDDEPIGSIFGGSLNEDDEAAYDDLASDLFAPMDLDGNEFVAREAHQDRAHAAARMENQPDAVAVDPDSPM